MKKTTALVFAILACGTLVAQGFYPLKRDRKFIASAGIGTSSYFGELSNDDDYIDARPNLGFGLQYFITNRIGTRAEISWFQLAGNDAEADDGGRVRRNLSFVSNNYEINIEAIVNLFPNSGRFFQRNPFNVYAFIGIGLINYNPKGVVPNVEYNGNSLPDAGRKVALRALKTEGVKYSSFTPVIPFGLGAKVKAGPFFNIAIEGGLRKTFTDYLDDVSTVYADKTTESKLAIAMADRRWALPDALPPISAGSKRGNPATYDAYFILNVRVEYFLPATLFSGIRKKRKPGAFKYKKYKRRAKRRYP